MPARYIFSGLAVVFLVAAALRMVRDGGRLQVAARTWLTIAVIFGLVSVWLWISVAPH